MKRLTTDTPDGNFETMLNFVFGKDGWAHIRHDSEEGAVPLTQWAKAQCILHGCAEFPVETPEAIDEEICDCLTMDFSDCPIALAYGFAVQACHLRDRLKMYEDVLFAEDGTERLTLADLRALALRKYDTQAQKIRQASDEEMSVILAEAGCVNRDDCDKQSTCEQCWLNWLLSPAEEG